MSALVALADSGELVSYSATGSELRDAYASETPWGRAIGESNAEAWDELASRLQETMSMDTSDALAAYEALEEEDLMQRLGVDACEVLLGESGNAGLCRSAIIEEIESRLHRTLPAIAEVRRRLGDEAAEEYRCDIETLEQRGWNLSVARDAPAPSPGPACTVMRKAGRAQELRDIAQMVSMAALPQPSDTIEAYVRMVERKKRFRRERRVELKQRNRSALTFARSLGFWFPYARDSPKWLKDPATAKLAPTFLELVRAARSRLAPQRCVMQYVPKRRLTRRAARELLKNMSMMVKFLVSSK